MLFIRACMDSFCLVTYVLMDNADSDFMYTLAHDLGGVNTVDGRDTTGAGLPLHGDQESNPLTDDAETASAYQTIVYQQSADEHDTIAGLGPLGRNQETTKHGYVEGLCYR